LWIVPQSVGRFRGFGNDPELIAAARTILGLLESETSQLKRTLSPRDDLTCSWYRGLSSDQYSLPLQHAEVAFHTTLADLSENPLLSLMVRALFDLLKRLRPEFVQRDRFMKETYKRHKGIIEAIRQKDISLCVDLLASDVDYTRKLKNLEPK